MSKVENFFFFSFFLLLLEKNIIMEYPSQYEKLLAENEDLKTKLTDLMFEMNYNKQTELIEFLREVYNGIEEEMSKEDRYKSSRDDILISLRKNIKEFAKNNKILL